MKDPQGGPAVAVNLGLGLGWGTGRPCPAVADGSASGSGPHAAGTSGEICRPLPMRSAITQCSSRSCMSSVRILTVSTRRSPGRRPTPAPTPFPHCPPDTFPYNRASMVQRFSSTGRVSAMPARRPAAIPSLPRTRHDGYTAIRQALEVQRGEYDEQRTGGT